MPAQEIKKILHGLSDLKIVGADIVEVAPGYDTQGGLYALCLSLALG